MHFDPTSPTASTLQPTGVLDRVQGAQLRQDVEALVRSGVNTLVLDCSDLALIDRSGLGALVVCLKALRSAGGNLYLRDLQEQGKLLLEVTGMDDVFAVV